MFCIGYLAHWQLIEIYLAEKQEWCSGVEIDCVSAEGEEKDMWEFDVFGEMYEGVDENGNRGTINQ
jgi:hypothetical protein